MTLPKKEDKYSALLADIHAVSAQTEEYMAGTFGEADTDINEVAEAMKYSLFAGGKRIRPYLVVSFCRLYGGRDEDAIPFAAAVEMMHTFSLIHDDLPCMDNDDLRRGKPTCHKVYGEATALLAGDALAIKSLGIAAKNENVPPEARLKAVTALSCSAAEKGMIGGQIMDMYGETHPLSLEKLIKLQSLKTGELMRVSAMLGAYAAGVSEEDARFRGALEYASGLGLAFQIRDDILDVVGNEKTLGKPIGSDKESGKNTFVTHMSTEEAENYARRVTEKAKNAISAYENSEMLMTLADFLLDRMK